MRDLKKYFPVRSGLFKKSARFVRAVDGVCFHIRDNESLALVGESGCGKTTIARLVVRLEDPTSGTIYFMDQDILKMDRKQMRKLRHEMQMVFQDPFAALNPRKTLKQILSQPYQLLFNINKDELDGKVENLLDMFGFTPSNRYMNRYPHEFSGGQRQRIVLARAISVDPRLLIADEPVAELDVSVRGKILNLLRHLQKKSKFSLLFITHDLALVRSMCDRVAVMYLGKIVETAKTEEIYENPMHPYTKALLSAVPIPDPKLSREKERTLISGEVPSAIDPPPGCRFHPRCWHAMPKCSKVEPEYMEKRKNHYVACHLY